MFKKFDCKESVSGVSQIKSSVQREIRNKILIDYSNADEHFDDIIPKKNLKLIKCHHHIELIAFSGEVIFFRDSQQHFIPSLKTIHKYPYILPKMQADDGAIDFILRGANIMCPGLTSKGVKKRIKE
ncbi:Translation machinery-associated protein 20 [Intoshia linei]|uniref:Translation machinery-associated protein 20 n=1 Tax=Intoshia linei TaxID=1819745 RepID=A0A177B1J4_9BILA|nr:Translation machinery-associated protein 20 [Intoshia linei]